MIERCVAGTDLVVCVLDGEVLPAREFRTEREWQDLATKNGKELVAFCRCWKSGSMPYCDGSHAKHNTACGDNTGPLLVPVPKKGN